MGFRVEGFRVDIGVMMEKKMDTTVLSYGMYIYIYVYIDTYIIYIFLLIYWGLYRGYIGIMEKEMEATIMGLYRVGGLGLKVWGIGAIQGVWGVRGLGLRV